MNYTARQAFCKSNEVLNNFDAVCTHVIFLCMENIKRYSEFHYNECSFVIPQYILGFAIFNPHRVKRKIKQHLRSLEYKVITSQSDNFILHISWEHIGNSVLSSGYLKSVPGR